MRWLLALSLSTLLTHGLTAATPTETLTATPTPSVTVSPTVTTTAVCDGTFGCVGCVATSGVGSAQSQFIAAMFTLPQAGTIRSVSLYMTAVTGARVRAGVYSDNAGYPGTLLADSGDKITVEGWNEISVEPFFLVAGDYWLAEVSESDLTVDRVVWFASPTGPKKSLGFTTPYGALPNAVPASVVGSTSTLIIYANYCPGPPIFFTPTPTPTATPTPIQYKPAPQGKLILGPVPASKGVPVCLYFDKAPASSTCEVFNTVGQRVSALSFGLGEQACWDTSGIAPGLYIARVKVNYAGGGSGEVTQKLVVTR